MTTTERLLLEHAAGIAASARPRGVSDEARAETREIAHAVADRVARLLIAEAQRDARLGSVLTELYH
jgi:hypothetical protein